MMEIASARAPATLRLARVSFTGRLASMTRREAAEIVRGAGGRVASGVSRRTTMVVVGMDGWPLLSDGTPSGKLRRAEELNRGGAQIAIVAETVFLECAGRRERRPAVRKSYPPDEVCTLLGLDLDTLRRWEALGLVRSHDGRLDFQDLVSLRTIAGLLQGGVPARTIGRSVEALAAVLPGTERPLAQLSLVARSGRLLAEIGDALLAPDGQFEIDFAPERSAGADRRTGRCALPFVADEEPRGAAPAMTADAWFDRGVACEECDRFDQAIEAYRAALALDPHLPEAHFNLGNALRAAERPAAAEEQFRMAVARDPAMAMAWYNLGDVQDEQGDVAGAVESLRRAVALDPGYADAHYNLALCCEAVGDAASARRHWNAYLRLDAASAWAEAARARLAALGPD